MTLLPGQCSPWIEGQNWLVDNHEDAICSSVALPLCVFASSLPLVWENELSANNVLLGSQTMLVSSGKVRFSRATILGAIFRPWLGQGPLCFPFPCLPGAAWHKLVCYDAFMHPGGRLSRDGARSQDLGRCHRPGPSSWDGNSLVTSFKSLWTLGSKIRALPRHTGACPESPV